MRVAPRLVSPTQVNECESIPPEMFVEMDLVEIYKKWIGLGGQACCDRV